MRYGVYYSSTKHRPHTSLFLSLIVLFTTISYPEIKGGVSITVTLSLPQAIAMLSCLIAFMYLIKLPASAGMNR